MREVDLEAPEKMVRRVAQDLEVTPVTEERGAPAVVPGYLGLLDHQVHSDQPVQPDQWDQREERLVFLQI